MQAQTQIHRHWRWHIDTEGLYLCHLHDALVEFAQWFEGALRGEREHQKEAVSRADVLIAHRLYTSERTIQPTTEKRERERERATTAAEWRPKIERQPEREREDTGESEREKSYQDIPPDPQYPKSNHRIKLTKKACDYVTGGDVRMCCRYV